MNLNPIINNFQRPIRKVQICCILIFSCAACSLNIPYENQYSDPDAITTVTAARELLASAYDAIPKPEFSLSVLSDDFQPTFLINLNADLNNLYKWHPKPMEDLSTLSVGKILLSHSHSQYGTGAHPLCIPYFRQ
ncbi:hypothetical protein NXV34_22655 [Bacteroides fragilis]|nr:hypothetical protein NXV34_22655 [Bacteroides fragilis]